MSDPLAKQPFSWRRAGTNQVQISYDGRPVTMLRGVAADKAIDRLAHASPSEAQQALARLTGNFKHGNERVGKVFGRP
jgi:hypothetical protein